MKNIEKQLQHVWNFQEKFQHKQSSEMNVSSDLRKRKQRIELFIEELEELETAIEEGNNLEILDSSIDMPYVNFGTIHFHGLGNVFCSLLKGEKEYTNTTIENYPKLLRNALNYGNFKNKYLQGKEKVTFLEITTFFLRLTVLNLSLCKKLESEGIVKKGTFEKAFLEVHSSNMSKADIHGNPIFREDGKILKGPNYYKPNLKQFLTKEANDDFEKIDGKYYQIK